MSFNIIIIYFYSMCILSESIFLSSSKGNYLFISSIILICQDSIGEIKKVKNAVANKYSPSLDS